jgi:hypothetical protein
MSVCTACGEFYRYQGALHCPLGTPVTVQPKGDIMTDDDYEQWAAQKDRALDCWRTMHTGPGHALLVTGTVKPTCLCGAVWWKETS